MVVRQGTGVQLDGIRSRKWRHKGMRLMMDICHDCCKYIVLVEGDGDYVVVGLKGVSGSQSSRIRPRT